MAQSPPASPSRAAFNRPVSLIMRPSRSSSRMSVGSVANSNRHCGSGISDEDARTAVKVGKT